MIQRFIILAILSLGFWACQDDISESQVDIPSEEDAITVKFAFGIGEQAEYLTEYPQMKSTAEDAYPIRISNDYKAIIVKKIGARWILDKVLEIQITPYIGWTPPKHAINKKDTVHSFSTDLRPGDYRMVIITGGTSVEWNKAQLKPGLIIDDGTSGYKVPMACHYIKVGEAFFNPGAYSLGEEIFSGVKDFKVEKTEDLHSGAKMQPLHMELERKVAKFRILMYDEEENNIRFNNTTYGENGISAMLHAKDSDKPFPYGLNVWGDPYYNDTDPVMEVCYGVMTLNTPIKANPSDPIGYFVPKYGERQSDIFIFSDPKQDIPITVNNISHTYLAGQPTFKYREVSPEMIIKHNYIDGLIVSPDGSKWEEPNPYNPSQMDAMRGMRIIYEGSKPKSSVGIFDHNIEYR